MSSTTTIMVVDDNETTRRLVRTALTRHGYSVIEAPDGATARELMLGSLEFARKARKQARMSQRAVQVDQEARHLPVQRPYEVQLCPLERPGNGARHALGALVVAAMCRQCGAAFDTSEDMSVATGNAVRRVLASEEQRPALHGTKTSSRSRQSQSRE